LLWRASLLYAVRRPLDLENPWVLRPIADWSWNPGFPNRVRTEYRYPRRAGGTPLLAEAVARGTSFPALPFPYCRAVLALCCPTSVCDSRRWNSLLVSRCSVLAPLVKILILIFMSYEPGGGCGGSTGHCGGVPQLICPPSALAR